MLQRLFKLRDRGTSVRTELLGGATTFVTMAYIIVVNPAILSFAGIPVGPSTVATILAAVVGSLLMGLLANRPIAVAPYMGENAFIAFGLVAFGITWQQRLGAVFVSGAVFALITLLGIRTWLARSISTSMKHSFAVGIGLFLALIGLYETGIVTSFVTGMPLQTLHTLPNGSALAAPDVPLKIGAIDEPQALLAMLGFLLIVVMLYWRIPGAILLGMLFSAALGQSLGIGVERGHFFLELSVVAVLLIVAVRLRRIARAVPIGIAGAILVASAARMILMARDAPSAFFAWPFVGQYDLSAVALKLDVAGVLRLSFLPILLTLFLMSLLDTLGTLMGVGAAGGMLDEKGDFPEIEKPMMADAAACMFSGLVGTSTSGAYIESATGIREGARTGLAAVATAFLFALSLFVLPLFQPLQHLKYAYAPPLIVVGLLMLSSIRKIDFEDLTELVPAFATVAMMVFTYNIGNGLTAGLVLHPLMKLLTGRVRELRLGSILLGLACALYFVFGRPH